MGFYCYRNNMEVFLKHAALLQVAMAVANTVENENSSTLEELQSTEKVSKCLLLMAMYNTSFQLQL